MTSFIKNNNLLLSTKKTGVIVWDTPVNISGNGNQVLTTGLLHTAFNFGGGTATTVAVNGVTFTALNVNSGSSITSGNINITTPIAFNNAIQHLSSTPGPIVTTPYTTLLNSNIGAVDFAADTNIRFNYTILGLTAGYTYILQYWVSFSNQGSVTNTQLNNRNVIITAPGSAQAALDVNTTDSTGGVGQFVIGTFVANSNTQQFTATPNGRPPGGGPWRNYCNALQVRRISI